MKVAAHDYALMLTSATNGGKYLADIDLQIEDMKGNTLLNTVSKGPLFLANLPVGRYKVTASAQGTSHTRIVDIPERGAGRLVASAGETGRRGLGIAAETHRQARYAVRLKYLQAKGGDKLW
jgi:hypothetical protein